jgi:hypothetical protein
MPARSLGGGRGSLTILGWPDQHPRRNPCRSSTPQRP